MVKQNAVVKSLPGEVDEEHRVEVENSDVDERATRDHATTVSAEPAGSVELKIATNKSFPEVRSFVEAFDNWCMKPNAKCSCRLLCCSLLPLWSISARARTLLRLRVTSGRLYYQMPLHTQNSRLLD